MAAPLAVRKGQFSCEFLAWLQELCLHGSQCLLSAQASWFCQVHITSSGCKRICIFEFVYVSVLRQTYVTVTLTHVEGVPGCVCVCLCVLHNS